MTENVNKKVVDFSEKYSMWEPEKLTIIIAAVWVRLLNSPPLFLLGFFLLAVGLRSFGFASGGRKCISVIRFTFTA